MHPDPDAWLTRPRRLDKFLADARAGARARLRAAFIEGRVRLNALDAAPPWALVDPTRDAVYLDGQRRALTLPTRYGLLHKPPGILSALGDVHGRAHLGDCLPPGWRHDLGHVGRLDRATTGAILLTDDGDLTWWLTEPGEHVWKRYRVDLDAQVLEDDPRLDRLRRGLWQGGAPLREARVQRATPRQLLVWIEEGRNRQIRRMMQQVGLPLAALHREAIGPLELGALPQGRLRALTPCEVRALYSDNGLARVAQRALDALQHRQPDS